MPAEISVYGVYLPGFIVLMLVAFVPARILWQILAWTRFYNLVWHRALFNLALYIIILGATSFLSHWLLLS